MQGMDTATVSRPIDQREDELARVVSWRFGQLARSGYGHEEAIKIACHTEIDLHAALSLVERGCAPETALQILL